jgi:MarR family transcriptional regulator, lower aerobic nicotinate degradation pathway regulator
MARPEEQSEVLNDELGWLIARSRRHVFRHANERLERIGASMFFFPLLRRVVEAGAMSQLELARLTAQHPAAVCRTLEDMERRKLVRRVRDKRDRRRVLVSATPQGRALFDRIHPEVILGVDEALCQLTHAERTKLRVLLRKLISAAADEPAPWSRR